MDIWEKITEITGLNVTDDAKKQGEESANQLWRKYGEGTKFSDWVDTQVNRAKQSGIWKAGMTMEEIVKANLSRGGDYTGQGTDNANPLPIKKEFKIAGFNGYVVIAVAAVGIITTVYLLKKGKNGSKA